MDTTNRNATSQATDQSSGQSQLTRSMDYIETLLERLPEDQHAARHVLMQQLAFDPSPEVLHCVLRVVHDAGSDKHFKELPRRSLILSIMAERQIYNILEPAQLDAEQIGQAAEELRLVTELHHQITAELTAVLETLPWEDHQRLTRLHEQLDPCVDSIEAVLTLVPHLERLARAAQDDSIGSTYPALTAAEADLFITAVGPQGEPTGNSHRLHLNALALRSLLIQHIEEWQAALDAFCTDDVAETKLNSCHSQLEQDKHAYDFFAGLIQQHMDTALRQKRSTATESLRELQRSLFKINLLLAPILRQGIKGCIETRHNGSNEPATQVWTEDEQRAAFSAAEASTQAVERSRMKRKEALLSAVPRPTASDLERTNQDRLRIKMLTAITGILLLGAIATNVILWSSTPKPISVNTADFSNTLTLDAVSSMGAILVSQINVEWSWRYLSRKERLDRLGTLGAQAVERGFETLILVDGNDTQLAIWTAQSGPTLLQDSHQ